MFNKICDYLYEYDFPVAGVFENYVDEIVDNYFKKLDKDKGYNVIYDNEILCKKVTTAFHNIVHDEFLVTDQIDTTKLWNYVQNNEHSICVNHNHVRTTTINAVFYVNPPAEGGGLEYILDDGVHYLQPKPNKLYVMPYWLYHKPTPQKDEDWRISFNIEYKCMARPVHRRTGTYW